MSATQPTLRDLKIKTGTVKRFKEVLQESLNMIPDCHNRLMEAQKQLQKLLENKDASWEGTEELKQAEDILEQINKENTN
ncbi:hypothetical protein RclHR1_02540023 [Rhizophagus clarus]|uniref:Tubulin-specific chaperone A n=1 Tax=Rhizophagus clarus TaxID=94130 RepID=A0A2Z6RCX3_9GLOM|nr:hypothetical protein RclHR1_02540023 [Rhizophagus clarus]